MDIFFILLALVWIVISAVAKKKKRAAQEEAKRAQMQTDQAGPERSAPADNAPAGSRPAASKADLEPELRRLLNPTESEPDEKPFDPFFGGLEPEKKPAPKPQRPAGQPLAPRVAATHSSAEHAAQPVRQRVGATPMTTTLRHTLEASSISGHAHTESSITGVEPECAPVPVRAAQPAVQAAPFTAFSWEADDARRGLILTEILGKPASLRR